MNVFALLLAALLLLAAPVALQAKKPAEVTWNAAETAPETPEEDQAHAEGRAVDINEVNGLPVSGLADPKTPEAVRARAAADGMMVQARKDVQVKAFLGPIGGFWRDCNDRRALRAATQADMEAHWDHLHVEVCDERPSAPPRP